MTVETLEKNLSQGNLNSLYLLYGEELYLLEKVVKKIKKLFGELVLGINYIQISETNIETLIANIETPTFGFNKKLIIIKNARLLNNANNNEIQKNIASHIKENIDTIRATTVLVFIEENFSKCDLQKVIEENGIVCNFERLMPFDIKRRLKAICNAYGVNINEPNLELLIETSGTDMQSLINEIRKLIEYTGKGGTIKKESIEKLATKEFEAKIFDLTDNLGKKNISKALETLKEIIYNREPVQKILITLYNHFKRIYLTKLCLEQKKEILPILQLKPNQTFLISKYKRQAEYFKAEELRKILGELISLDKNSKDGLININIGLEAILCTYI